MMSRPLYSFSSHRLPDVFSQYSHFFWESSRIRKHHDLFRDSSDVWRMPCAMRLDSLRAVWALNDAFLSNKSVANEASDFRLSSVAF